MTDQSSRFEFAVTANDPRGSGRTGSVVTPHGRFATPAFMPVGTQATVKGLLPAQVHDSGAEIILANTYHLHLRPGEELVRELGGLHEFMGWCGPILTDSGGYQVFSLGHLREIDEGGVSFRSHVDGALCRLTPESAMSIQIALGSDIIMSFDECIPYPVDRSYVEASVERTTRWEAETLEYHPRDGRAVFGIVQGGVHADLRRRSARQLADLPFDGYAAGGLFVGEERAATVEMLEVVRAEIPDRFPRYVMGVGTPLEILDAVARGWDMFDCVLPTRNARHGQAMTDEGILRLKNARFRADRRPIAAGCRCLACREFSRAYLRHLLVAGEMLAATLISHHNLCWMQSLMTRIRAAIPRGDLERLRDELADSWSAT